MPDSGKSCSPRVSKYRNSRASSVLPSSMRGPAAAKVSCWLALRASVLRRAVSSSGTAQERRAKVRSGAVSRDFGCTEPIRWASASRQNPHAVPQAASVSTSTPPRKSVAEFWPEASNGFKVSALSNSNQRQCWLTIRSTGHFAAHRRWASFHSRPTPLCRKMPVSSNVRRHRQRHSGTD